MVNDLWQFVGFSMISFSCAFARIWTSFSARFTISEYHVNGMGASTHCRDDKAFLIDTRRSQSNGAEILLYIYARMRCGGDLFIQRIWIDWRCRVTATQLFMVELGPHLLCRRLARRISSSIFIHSFGSIRAIATIHRARFDYTYVLYIFVLFAAADLLSNFCLSNKKWNMISSCMKNIYIDLVMNWAMIDEWHN